MTTEDMKVHVKGLNPTSSALNLPLSLSSCCSGESWPPTNVAWVQILVSTPYVV